MATDDVAGWYETEYTHACQKLAQTHAELAQARIELRQIRKLWLNPAGAAQIRAELVDACAARDALARERDQADTLLSDAMNIMQQERIAAQKQGVDLCQVHAELKDLQGANRAFARQLDDVTENREFWYKEAQDAENERDEIKDELGFVRQAMQEQNDEVQELWLSPVEAEGLKRQLAKAQTLLAAAQKAAKWLWGFYDGNSLRAIPGFEDDIKRAWGDLLIAVDQADDAILGRLAILDTVEATLADCGTGGVYAEFDEPADAIVQMDDRIKKLTARLTTLDAAEALLKDRQGSLDRACIELDAAEAALEACGIAGICDTFDSLPDVIQQMTAHIHELSNDLVKAETAMHTEQELKCTERRLRQRAEASERAARETLAQAVVAQADAELAAHFHSKAVDELTQTVETGRQLRQGAEQLAEDFQSVLLKVHDALDEYELGTYDEPTANAQTRVAWLGQLVDEAEHRAGDLHRELDGVHEALNECQVPRNYPDGTGASRRTRIFWLNQRAENAEAELSNGHKALTAAGVPLSDASDKLSITGRVVRLRQRAERAETLTQLVTKKAADLLERLANHTAAYADSFADPNSSWTLLRRAEIREALDDDKAT